MASPDAPCEHTGSIRAWLMYANVPVGLIAVGFVLGSAALLDVPVRGPLLGLAFCGTFLVYQLERALHPVPEDVVNHPARLAWVARRRRWVWGSSFIAALASLVLLPALRPITLAVTLALAVVALLYAVPLLPGRRRLKAFGVLKPLVIAGAWAVGGVVLPALDAGRALDVGVLALVGYRLFFVLPNALLADWPDRAGDGNAGLVTPAGRLDARALRRWAIGSLLGAVLCSVGVAYQLRPGALLLVDGLGLFWMALAVNQHPTPSRWFYGFVMDVIVGWPVVTALMTGCALG